VKVGHERLVDTRSDGGAKGKLLSLAAMKRSPAPETTRQTEEDEGLLAACAAGDLGALGKLFDRHALVVRRFLMRCSGSLDLDLDDMVHATFIEAFRNAGKFRGRSAERSWLLGIALNIARHRRRGEGRRRTFLGLWARRDLEPTVRPDEALERRHTLARIDAALATLPSHLREAFVLCEVEELTGREAASILGIPVGTLGRHLHEARQALRDRLMPEGST
jgi:RNA polymerase sigma-70 factor (ECF subfamily)